MTKKRTKKEIEESEARYRELFEAESDAIFLIDNETGRILEANTAATVLYGFEHDALLQMRNVELSAEPEETRNITQGTPVVHENIVTIPLRYHRRKDGSVFAVEMTGRFFLSQGRAVHIVAIRDISSRKQAEEEALSSARLLQSSNAEKDKLFSIIAHDLRSPFNTFLGNTELLLENADSMPREQIVAMAARLNAAAINMYQLLENLLEWSQMQQGTIPCAPERFLALPFISDSVASLMEAAHKKSIEIRYEIPDDLEVVADTHMLQSLVRNLISNAVKFTPRGGAIVVSGGYSKERMVEISVRDNGIGMSGDLLEKLFCISENTKRKGTEGERSTGLGLLLCKDYVERHHGSIRVESVVDAGSTFTFTLPLPDSTAL